MDWTIVSDIQCLGIKMWISLLFMKNYWNLTLQLSRQCLKKFDIAYKEENLLQAIENSRFKNFKKIEQTYGHSRPDENESDFSFARKGEAGDYKNHFNEKCHNLYDQLLKKYGFESYSSLIEQFRKQLNK